MLNGAPPLSFPRLHNQTRLSEGTDLIGDLREPDTKAGRPPSSGRAGSTGSSGSAVGLCVEGMDGDGTSVKASAGTALATNTAPNKDKLEETY